MIEKFVSEQEGIVLDIAVAKVTNYPIRPEDIDTEEHFWESFGSHELEILAHWIVEFCQKRGNWGPFTKIELEAFYASKVGRETDFSCWVKKLAEKRNIIESDGTLCVTHSFVATCFRSSPKVEEM